MCFMPTLEYEVLQNLSGVEGSVSGYFAAGRDSTLAARSIIECAFAIEDDITIPEVKRRCIPLILNEFGVGVSLQNHLAQLGNTLPGLVTFGEDEDKFVTHKPQDSHLNIFARELAVQRPSFLAVLCKIPDSVSDLDKWCRQSPLGDLHLRFGSLAVRGNTCTIATDEAVMPLKDT